MKKVIVLLQGVAFAALVLCVIMYAIKTVETIPGHGLVLLDMKNKTMLSNKCASNEDWEFFLPRGLVVTVNEAKNKGYAFDDKCKKSGGYNDEMPLLFSVFGAMKHNWNK